jgi:hypothetical protein
MQPNVTSEKKSKKKMLSWCLSTCLYCNFASNDESKRALLRKEGALHCHRSTVAATSALIQNSQQKGMKNLQWSEMILELEHQTRCGGGSTILSPGIRKEFSSTDNLKIKRRSRNGGGRHRRQSRGRMSFQPDLLLLCMPLPLLLLQPDN